jgi:cyclopropane fatty-acyl-phospholipid synthase-like methyltransferase
MGAKTAELVHFLKKQNVSAGLVDRLKISYRPLICPFDDLLNLVKPGANVLDVGCGAGQFLTLVSEFTKANKLAGLEISKDLILQADELLNPLKSKNSIRLSTYDGIQFPDFVVEYDTVFLIDVLHHVPKNRQVQFLSNLYHNLNSGTTFILKDINAASAWVYFNKLHDLVLSHEIGNELSVTQAVNLVTEIGFRVLSCSEKQLFGYPHYILVLKK